MHSEYPEEITDKTQILAIQVLIASLVVSAIFYAIVVLIFTMPGVVQHTSEPDPTESLPYTYLTFFTLVLTAAVIPASSKLFQTYLTKLRDSDESLVHIRTAYVVKFAAIEGVALLGLTFVLLAATELQIDDNPIIWLNTAPFLWLLMATITTFPTKDRIKQAFSEYSAY